MDCNWNPDIRTIFRHGNKTQEHETQELQTRDRKNLKKFDYFSIERWKNIAEQVVSGRWAENPRDPRAMILEQTHA